MNIVGLVVPPHIVIANRFFIIVLCGLALFSISLAPWHGTWTSVLLVAMPGAGLPILFILQMPSALFTRMTVAAAVMIFCGLNIHQSHGMDLLHLGIFVLLALLVIYEDWRIILAAAALIMLHHVLFNYLQAAHYRLWCFSAPNLSMVFFHSAYVIVESAGLCYLAVELSKKTFETTGSRPKMQEDRESMRSAMAQAHSSLEAMTAAWTGLAISFRAIADGAVNNTSSLDETPVKPAGGHRHGVAGSGNGQGGPSFSNGFHR
jgi:methyl-accepting chemotaxis protein